MADGSSSVIRTASSHTHSHKTATHFRTSAVNVKNLFTFSFRHVTLSTLNTFLAISTSITDTPNTQTFTMQLLFDK
jgi:hypothetical protein